MKLIKLLFFVCLAVLSLHVYSQSPVLTVTVPNINPVQGEIQVSVFNSKTSFLKEGKEYKIYRFKVDKASGKFVINDLPKGEYAMIIYHDKNNNKEMDRSMLGIPKEGFGFSKNFKPKLSGPGFGDCSINLNADMEIDIKLMY